MRGTWQGGGTWESSGGGGIAVLWVIAAVAVIGAVEWLAARLWWLLGGTVLVIALAAVTLRWLIRRQERRETVRAARLPFVLAREAPVAVTSAPRRELPAPAIHLHLHGDDGMEAAARIIRTALPGQAGIQPEGNRNGIASHDT